MATSANESMDWMKELDKRVASVVNEIAELRKKNRSLMAKVTRLERQARGRSEAEESEWAEARAEVRKRVEELTSGLESLLEES